MNKNTADTLSLCINEKPKYAFLFNFTTWTRVRATIPLSFQLPVYSSCRSNNNKMMLVYTCTFLIVMYISDTTDLPSIYAYNRKLAQ